MWILNMEADLAKVRRWVKEADAGEEVLNQLPFSAADKVEKFREMLSKIWEPQKEIQLCSDLDELMDTICMKKRHQQENIRIWANELQRIINNSTGRAGGPHRWTPDRWCTLPKEFFERLAEVWVLCLEESRLLEIWKQIRVVGIPKADGGTRPLSVAVVTWRAGTTIIVRKLARPKKLLAGLGTDRRQRSTPDSRKPWSGQG